MKYVWLVTKHPRNPFRNGHLEAFTILQVCQSHAEAANIAKNKNKRSGYLHIVKRLKVAE